jgi:hypothetical protein
MIGPAKLELAIRPKPSALAAAIVILRFLLVMELNTSELRTQDLEQIGNSPMKQL